MLLCFTEFMTMDFGSFRRNVECCFLILEMTFSPCLYDIDLNEITGKLEKFNWVLL